MSWLVTGGAGYIGAHVVRSMVAAGHDVVVVDDMSTGRPERLGAVPLVEASVLDATALVGAVRRFGVDGVVHIAAKKQVGESVGRPLHYFAENVGGIRTLLEVMVAEGVQRLVFSSSAAVYGNPDAELITEDIPCRPINPYGESKLVGEWIVADVARAHGLRAVSLRYFNVAGAAAPELGDDFVLNLIPMVFERITRGERPRIFGDDYPTPDGTCIRDYIHVDDVATAHVAAARYLDREAGPEVFNIGRGQGYSVSEVVRLVADVTGIELDPEVTGRRAGDPPKLVASARRIEDAFGWSARHDLREMVASAWEGWCLRHPSARELVG